MGRDHRGITLIALVITVIILLILAGITFGMTIGENGIITKAKQAKENTITASKEEEEALNKLWTELENNGEVLGGSTDEGTTALAEHILLGHKAYSKGTLLIGTMPNRGSITQTLSAGESYTIPEGYHNGSGKVTAKDLASQTVATATADDITEGKTAWVNGIEITGTKTNQNLTFLTTIYNNGATGKSTTYTFNKDYDIVYLFGHSISNYNNGAWPSGMDISTSISHSQIYYKRLSYEVNGHQDVSLIWVLQNVKAGNTITLRSSVLGEIAVLTM